MIEKKLNVNEEGCAVDMHQYDTGMYLPIIAMENRMILYNLILD